MDSPENIVMAENKCYNKDLKSKAKIGCERAYSLRNEAHLEYVERILAEGS